MSSNDDLYREGGALGVYSYYYQTKKDNFNKVRLTSPIRGQTMTSVNGGHLPPSRLQTPVSMSRMPRLDIVSPKPIDEDLVIPNNELVAEAIQRSPLIRPSKLDLWIRVMSQLAGKDKVGKCIQYGLRILIAYSIRARKTQFLNNFKLTSVDFNGKTQDVLRQLVAQPELIVVLFLGQFEARFVGLTKILSIYRQMLRAGTVPTKVLKLLSRISETVGLLQSSEKASTKLQRLKSDWCNFKSLGEVCALYYAWFDESLLAYKIGLLDEKTTPNYRRFAVRHEALAWYTNIILGLRAQFEKLSQLSNKENSLKINYQVKQRAKRLVSTIKADQSPISLYGPLENTDAKTQLVQYSTELKKISKEKYMVQLEILKLLCDFAYDTVSVFHLKVDEPLHLLFGLGAGAISLSKIWIAEKDKMEKELNPGLN
ncbi:hypothetical protein KL930_001484 [Ogataea haglerorum]|uniref:Peroxisomal membrane protein PEX25 n=1 Tax=Ogataea haglerorum TaxID=1937702 RepID=A0ABQ7R8X4_9ASCO|nr:uncharacterized protein KL911_004330 [Ogataea haglerorum]KAG7698706.1 hypothetical protein KL951_001970 [Ogataea haglerorum]KAG7704160.1 hypothetical protein KL950_004487 [Ogataea haglerorum]KAG7735782.1 hypothetical protein KL923_005369 [Ogataea haglerorum]KAG7746057.1 hypothetical protein KL912_004618 [Ogataea haglerorum]KAG7751752.1 hypothetical protein KL911_004330 [Ogataea haglerorum]